MEQHVFARLSGYNLTLLPLAPFRYRQVVGDDRRLVLSHSTEGQTKQALLVAEDGTYRVELATGTGSFAEVADILPGAWDGTWRIETALFSLMWPQQFDFVSAPDTAGPSLFDLIGSDDALIYIQGPFATARLPALEQMAAPSQSISARGSDIEQPWIELIYDHEGMDWVQRHYLKQLDRFYTLVVTMQAPRYHAQTSIAAAEMVVQTLEPLTARD